MFVIPLPSPELRRNLAGGVVARHLQQVALRQTFSRRMDGAFRKRQVEQVPTTGSAIVKSGAPRASQSLVFDFRLVRGIFFSFPPVSLHVFYYAHPRMKGLALMEGYNLETKNLAMQSRSRLSAHETRSVVNVFPGEHIESGVGLTQRTAGAVPGTGEYHAQPFG